MVLARPFIAVAETLTDPDPREMPLVEHLEELRRRLGVCLCAVAAGSIAGWFLVQPVFTLLVAPLLPYRRSGVTLVLGKLTDPFVLEMKLALAVGLALALPVLLAQAWLFIAPALAVQARRYVLPIVALGIVLFITGAAVGYTLFPMVVRFLLGQAHHLPGTLPLLQVGDYVTQFALVLIVFGAIFELPVVLAALAQLGIVSSRWLAARRRYVALLGLIVAMIITPGADPITPLITAGLVYLLYEASILLVRALRR